MNCLIDYIGLQGCGNVMPESGLFINSLPGISLKSIDGLADSEQKTYVTVWNNIQQRAVRRLANELNNEFRKRYKIKTLRKTVNTGKIIDTASTTAPAVITRGIVVDLGISDAQWTQSTLQTLYIQEVNLYLSSVPASDFDVVIYNFDTGEEILTETIDVDTLAIGWNRIPLNQAVSCNEIFIGYDATEITSVESTLPSWLNDYVSGGCGSCFGIECQSTVKGATTTDYTTYTLGTNGFGLNVVFSLQCSYESLICDNKNIITNALWYMLGMEVMTELMGSDRLNQWTLDKAKAQKLHDYYLHEFQTNLTNAVSGITLDIHDACLECNQPYKTIEQHP